MKTTYEEIEIEYREGDNKWGFTLNGRQRSAESLAKAKEFIDKWLERAGTEREPPFQRVDAYYYGYEEFKRRTITSIAEGRSYNGKPYVWTVDEKGKREKENSADMILITPKNVEKIKELADITKKEKELSKQWREIFDSLSRFEVKDE